MNNEDHVERLELLDKVLGISALVFWFLCAISLKAGVIWYIGILLPVIGINLRKPIVLLGYALCVIIYVVVAIIITNSLFCFVPHLACCACIIGESLMAGTIKEIEKCQSELCKIKEQDNIHMCQLKSLKAELSSVKAKTFRIAKEQQIYDDETDEVILLARNKVLSRFCNNLLNDIEEYETVDRGLYM